MKLYVHEFSFRSALQHAEETLFLSEYQHTECEEEFASVWVTPREYCPVRVTLEDVLLYLSYLQEEEFASVWVTPRECCPVRVTLEDVLLYLSYLQE